MDKNGDPIRIFNPDDIELEVAVLLPITKTEGPARITTELQACCHTKPSDPFNRRAFKINGCPDLTLRKLLCAFCLISDHIISYFTEVIGENCLTVTIGEQSKIKTMGLREVYWD